MGVQWHRGLEIGGDVCVFCVFCGFLGSLTQEEPRRRARSAG